MECMYGGDLKGGDLVWYCLENFLNSLINELCCHMLSMKSMSIKKVLRIYSFK